MFLVSFRTPCCDYIVGSNNHKSEHKHLGGDEQDQDKHIYILTHRLNPRVLDLTFIFSTLLSFSPLFSLAFAIFLSLHVFRSLCNTSCGICTQITDDHTNQHTLAHTSTHRSEQMGTLENMNNTAIKLNRR